MPNAIFQIFGQIFFLDIDPWNPKIYTLHPGIIAWGEITIQSALKLSSDNLKQIRLP